jgi:hypothetical protein
MVTHCHDKRRQGHPAARFQGPKVYALTETEGTGLYCLPAREKIIFHGQLLSPNFHSKTGLMMQNQVSPLPNDKSMSNQFSP